MIKKYPTSKLFKILSLGFKRFFFKIENDTLTIIKLFPVHIDIGRIKSISYGLGSVKYKRYIRSYFYTITDINGESYQLPYSALEGNVYKELIADLEMINPQIKISDDLKEFLNIPTPDLELKPDFRVHKGNFFKRDMELSQKYPSIDALIGFSLVFILIIIPLLFGGYGHSLLEAKFGSNYQNYRIWTFVFGGIFFALCLSNLVISFVSMYLGHKTTIGLIISSALCLIISIL